MRPSKPLAAALLVLLGAYLGMPSGRFLSGTALLAAGVVLIVTAFAFVINDYRDAPADAVAKPYRPIPSGRVTKGQARALAWVLAAAALAVSTALGVQFAVIAAAALALSWAYSYGLKDTLLLGNAVVALLVMAALLYGALAVDRVPGSVWMAAVVILPYVLAQEVLFALEDEVPDRLAGLKTTATRLGAARTALLARASLAIFILGVFAPWVVGPASSAYLAAGLLLLVLPAACQIYLLRQPLSHLAVARAASLSRLVWLASFVPLALLK